MAIAPALRDMLERNTIPRRQLLGRRYHVVTDIGKGMFSEAFLVEDKQAGGALAVVKSSRIAQGNAEGMNREQQLRLAISEARIMAMFNDDGVVRLLDFWCEDGIDSICFLMEYCAGGDLEAYLRLRYPLAEGLLLVFFVQCLLAVAHIHTKGVIHRDLKPANILVAEGDSGNTVPTLKLTDFGLSAMNNAGTALEELSLVGTPLYMSPEVIQHGACVFGSDVWSLGVVFYRLITNEQPFNALNQRALHFSIVNTQPPHPCSVAKHYSRELGDLVMVMLEKDIAKRPTARYLIASPLFERVLQRSPWRSRPLRGATCLFVCRTDRTVNILAEPHFSAPIVATLGFGEHVFVSNRLCVRTVLKQCSVTGAVTRAFTWLPPQASNGGNGRSDGAGGSNPHALNPFECSHRPVARPPRTMQVTGEGILLWYRVVGPREGYCAPSECGRNLLWHVHNYTPCGPLPTHPAPVTTNLPRPVSPGSPDKKQTWTIGQIISSLFGAHG
ncbi:protein kinase, putative [Trypanosoma equiperdum]|uniref:non-specific serine/threonine protein kinase n=1 Tax=Trypanosoma equiperdum TaxID=5694 RepID=A0A1G4IF92_TRYEQ|nr:protein kinase, putative [Trypanosoma equiperdum]